MEGSLGPTEDSLGPKYTNMEVSTKKTLEEGSATQTPESDIMETPEEGAKELRSTAPRPRMRATMTPTATAPRSSTRFRTERMPPSRPRCGRPGSVPWCPSRTK